MQLAAAAAAVAAAGHPKLLAVVAAAGHPKLLAVVAAAGHPKLHLAAAAAAKDGPCKDLHHQHPQQCFLYIYTHIYIWKKKRATPKQPKMFSRNHLHVVAMLSNHKFVFKKNVFLFGPS